MIPNPHILKAQLKDTPYLLPYGQGIAERIFGISTNEAGLLLWDGLCQGEDPEALLDRLCAFYEAEPQEREVLREDLNQYLCMLLGNHLVSPQTPLRTVQSFAARAVKIGPLTLLMQIPERLFADYFSAFETDLPTPEETDLQLQLLPGCPPHYTTGEILVRNEEMLISDCGEQYVLIPQRGRFVFELRLAKDGRSALLFSRCEEDDEACLEELFHIIRFAFLLTAQQKGLCVVHSASILHDGRAWLFSGPSGTGKSTHTRFWHEQFGSPFLNGDLNLLGMENGQPVCYGLPWCGTSHIYSKENHPLGGVVFLKQAPYNNVASLSADREILSLTQRMITPSWTKEQLQKNLSLAETLAEKIRIFRLECTKQPEAAEIMRAAIDASAAKNR